MPQRRGKPTRGPEPPAATGPAKPAGSVEAGQEALERGDWESARDSFREAARNEESAEAWEGLAIAAAWLEDVETIFEARERAHRLFLARRDLRGAARLAIWLALDYADWRGEVVVANGWLRRASRLLEGLEPTPEHGLVLLLEGHLALMADYDLVRARSNAAAALEVAHTVGSEEVEFMALALDGLTRVSQGEVASGMELLDEATAAALSAEGSDLNLVGTACCYLIHACERVRDFERAGQWCLRVQEFCRRWRYTSMFTVCRTQYASVLMMRGAWIEAESELSAAMDELARRRPAGLSAAVARLGELRRRQGKTEEASELFARAGSYRLALLGRAEIALERGDLAEAADLVARTLRRIPKDNRTERVAGLELDARVAVAQGDRARAAETVVELEEIGAVIGTDPLRAVALYARGALARMEGDLESARKRLEDAVELFERAAIPYEEATAHLILAATLKDLQLPAAARAEAQAARAILGKIGAVLAEKRAGILLDEYDRACAVTTKDDSGPLGPEAISPLTLREIHVLRLVAEGASDREIARRLHLSPHTVHRHVANILTKLDLPSRAAAVAHASRLGLL
jgi:LuxR family transcriptional regulator, maltose regulon positive regulatory protein